jgi:hypothetical protein
MFRHAATIAIGDWANKEKPAIRARFQIKSVTSIVVLRLAEYLNVIRTPPRARLLNASLLTVPLMLSMTISTPLPSVIRRTPPGTPSADRSTRSSKQSSRALAAFA